MAAKTTLRVGQKVKFGDSKNPIRTGIIKKLNPKTACISVPGSGIFDVHYRNINTKKSKAVSGRAKAKGGKGKRTTKPKLSAARRDALLLKLERAWAREERKGRAPSMSTFRSNPKKRKRKAKRNCGLPPRNRKGQFKRRR
jgi:hypothetical protein